MRALATPHSITQVGDSFELLGILHFMGRVDKYYMAQRVVHIRFPAANIHMSRCMQSIIYIDTIYSKTSVPDRVQLRDPTRSVACRLMATGPVCLVHRAGHGYTSTVSPTSGCILA